MCQLLGMNCNTPTDIVFSFDGFRRRGGLTDTHADGFGIAFFEDKGVRIYLDDKASAASPVADLIHQYPIKSMNVIAHIRKATQGAVTLANTHPFIREIWGAYWVFAHNGNLIDYHYEGGDHFNPVGQTDSEQAFCFLLEHLKQKYPHQPDKKNLFQEIKRIAEQLRHYGVFNFTLSNGIWLIAHCNTNLHYIIRKAPFGQAQLIDKDRSIDFAKETTPNDQVAVIATFPLTSDEQWTPFAVNSMILFENGEPVLC